MMKLRFITYNSVASRPTFIPYVFYASYNSNCIFFPEIITDWACACICAWRPGWDGNHGNGLLGRCTVFIFSLFLGYFLRIDNPDYPAYWSRSGAV